MLHICSIMLDVMFYLEQENVFNYGERLWGKWKIAIYLSHVKFRVFRVRLAQYTAALLDKEICIKRGKNSSFSKRKK